MLNFFVALFHFIFIYKYTKHTTTTTTQNGGSESQGGTPFATTGSDGSVNLHVYLTGLRDYGYLNIEVSKTGYGTYTDRVPVAI